MSQLFIPDGSAAWSVLSLVGAGYRLAVGRQVGASVPAVAPHRGGRLSAKTALLLRRSAEAGEANTAVSSADWAVVAGPAAGVRVNGVPLASGVAVLRHRDEIRVAAAAPVYFSAERVAAAENYMGSDSPRCPRCTLPIEEGQAAVRCPGCGVLHHELADRTCWTYAATCALCDQSSDLEAGLRWSPEGL